MATGSYSVRPESLSGSCVCVVQRRNATERENILKALEQSKGKIYGPDVAAAILGHETDYAYLSNEEDEIEVSKKGRPRKILNLRDFEVEGHFLLEARKNLVYRAVGAFSQGLP